MSKLTIMIISRPASPKVIRQAPPAPNSRPAPPAPQQNQNQAPMQMMQNQTPPQVQANQNGFTFTVTPSNLVSAFNSATSLMNNLTNLQKKMEPPSRPAPTPLGQANGSASTSSLPNPLIPQ